ncbi:hypothetical protein AQF52_7950 [Streptomyces venezuelae]|uniref:hypothetical protein n=1 Tax=Streptomyces gardneri TaxID=66892 RepID=UPI0006BC52EF|nr:hypothetical protein [Streptomyces gardneri]ALO13532.1 hypothetical protein AQF52_7950 [Streptomyces venezuelae]WRK41739.1 hypothetical protein U0M97_40095 [Streptomyces venezuelae]CUM35713.1 Beta-galactosidase [Streptomyces venezuelae]
MADDEQRQEFDRLRRRENQETDFTYPPLTYTASESDLTPPARARHGAGATLPVDGQRQPCVRQDGPSHRSSAARFRGRLWGEASERFALS